ncbi:flagellar assembly protein FliH [Metabacillus iocasae]|uniref:Flagellar assembly protein FliH n=1 Tax=Priestia iocasae TaxID=2291674 RepID=A0ABS2QQY2_9BACI|nr:flagellar assembly protein FliH [Metabacillus iocasae]
MSNVIKSLYTERETQSEKQIQIKPFYLENTSELNKDVTFQEETAEQIIQDAKVKAKALQEQAEGLVIEARRQIEIERQQWNEERFILEQEAKKQGYEDGMEQGKQEGYSHYDTMLREANEIVNQSKDAYYQYLQQSEEVIFQLGFTLAEKIIGQQLESDQSTFLSIIKKAIKEVRDEKEIQIFVSPSHYKMVHEQKEQLLSLLNGEATLFIYVDEELHTHSCMIESAFGRIDVSIDSQLSELKEKLAELLMGEMNSEGGTIN